jgi:hypothetical protein
MWQITWILGFFPSWFWTTALIFGIIGLLTSWIFTRLPYTSQVKVISILGIVVSVWALGAASNEEKWQTRIKELETQLAAAQAAAAVVTRGIEVKVVEKTKIIREKGKTQIEYIDRVVTQDREVIKYVEKCPVPKAIVDEHNKAAMPPEVIKEINKAAEGVQK